MSVYDTGRDGQDRYVATSGHLRASGWTAGMAARELAAEQRIFDENREAELRFLGGIFGTYVMPVVSNAFTSVCNLVIRPIPTVLVGATFWGVHWLAMLFAPAGSWWAWGAHALFAVWGLGAMAKLPGEIERGEGMVITELFGEWPAAYKIVYWAAMGASLWASGYMAGLAFDWAAEVRLVNADQFEHFRDWVQVAVASATLVWRGDRHPTMERPLIPWLG